MLMYVFGINFQFILSAHTDQRSSHSSCFPHAISPSILILTIFTIHHYTNPLSNRAGFTDLGSVSDLLC